MSFDDSGHHRGMVSELAGLFLETFEVDAALALFGKLLVYKLELAFQAVLDEFDHIFFFGFSQDIAGSDGGKGEGLQIAHLLKGNQDNRAAESFIFAEDREVLTAAAFALVAEAGGIDKVAGKFAHVVGCHFDVFSG